MHFTTSLFNVDKWKVPLQTYLYIKFKITEKLLGYAVNIMTVRGKINQKEPRRC